MRKIIGDLSNTERVLLSLQAGGDSRMSEVADADSSTLRDFERALVELVHGQI